MFWIGGRLWEVVAHGGSTVITYLYKLLSLSDTKDRTTFHSIINSTTRKALLNISLHFVLLAHFGILSTDAKIRTLDPVQYYSTRRQS